MASLPFLAEFKNRESGSVAHTCKHGGRSQEDQEFQVNFGVLASFFFFFQIYTSLESFWNEGTSAEKMPPLDCPVCKFVVHFLY